jgi:hypothetical protein
MRDEVEIEVVVFFLPVPDGTNHLLASLPFSRVRGSFHDHALDVEEERGYVGGSNYLGERAIANESGVFDMSRHSHHGVESEQQAYMTALFHPHSGLLVERIGLPEGICRIRN